MTPPRHSPSAGPARFASHAASHHKRDRGFTLIELSVTIVIIGLLTTLFLAGISKSREAAASAACAGQLRQLAAAFHMYLGDNNGQPPPANYSASDPGSEGHNGPGLLLLRPYYRNGPRYVWTTDNKFIREPLEICPSVRLNKLSTNRVNGPDYGYYVDETVNYMTHFLKPAQTPLIWDSWKGTWIPGDTVPLRHANAINCAFHDGHVESIKADDGRLYSKWWYYAVATTMPDPTQLKAGAPLGSATVPN